MKKIKLLLVTIVSILLFVIGCENVETADIVNEEITESAEMEAYILAGLDLQHSLNQFKQELRSIDVLSITPKLDSRGNMVINLPTRICIEQKTKDFNTKKRALLQKYPELTTMKSVKRLDHIKVTVDNSLKITKAIMEFESTPAQPRLRSEPTPTEFFTQGFSTEEEAFAFLDQQIASSNYVEVVLIKFRDGTFMTVISDINTDSRAYIKTGINPNNGRHYLSDENGMMMYPSSIDYVAHTHNDPSGPSNLDLEAKTQLDGVPTYIYCTGTGLNPIEEE